MREALATADPDFVRREPRAKSARRSAKSAATSWWQLGHRTKRSKRRLALVAAGILAVAIVGILANALLLQKTRHPAPLLGRPASAPKPAAAHVSARPQRPEPPPAAAPSSSQGAERAPPDKPVAEAPIVAKPHQPVATGPVVTKPSDAIGQLLKSGAHEPKSVSPAERRPVTSHERRPAANVERQTTAPNQNRPAVAIERRTSPSPQASRTLAAAQSSRTVAAAQRALVKLGFVLEADGFAGAATRKAIERYERERGLPAHGSLSPEVVRRLAGESGIAID